MQCYNCISITDVQVKISATDLYTIFTIILYPYEHSHWLFLWSTSFFCLMWNHIFVDHCIFYICFNCGHITRELFYICAILAVHFFFIYKFVVDFIAVNQYLGVAIYCLCLQGVYIFLFCWQSLHLSLIFIYLYSTNIGNPCWFHYPGLVQLGVHRNTAVHCWVDFYQKQQPAGNRIGTKTHNKCVFCCIPYPLQKK